MPRNGSGTYSKPAGTTFVPNTTIESSKVNSLADDIVDDLNAARPVTAGGTGQTSVPAARQAFTTYTTKSAGYTAAKTDAGAIHRCSAEITVALTAATTLGANWTLTVIADGGNVTIDPDSSETINGEATLVVSDGSAAYIVCSGSAFVAVTIPSAASVADGLATRVDTAAEQPFTPAQQAQARTNISAALKGHIYGLTLSNNASDATNDIDIAAGEAASTESGPVLMVLASALTKRLDAAWAVGSGNGGLDTGSITNGTYHVWLIQRSDTGVVDALFSTSATSPTMPTNYDRKRRIGAIMRVSAVIVPFIQTGNYFDLNPSLAQSNATISTTPTLITFNVPTGVRVRAKVSASSGRTGANVIYMSDPAKTHSVVDLVASGTDRAAALVEMFTNTSGQINVSNNASTSVSFTTQGWTDERI